jgi:hypothetical protein
VARDREVHKEIGEIRVAAPLLAHREIREISEAIRPLTRRRIEATRTSKAP